MFRLNLILIAPVLIILPAVGCSGDAPADPPPTEPDLRPWASGPHAEVGLESTSGEDVHLSWVLDMDVDSEGRVYIADQMAKEVIVLDPDLRYGRTIGREGEGPGEFRVVSSGADVARGQPLRLGPIDDAAYRVRAGKRRSRIHTQTREHARAVGRQRHEASGTAGLIGTSRRTYRASGPTEEEQRPSVSSTTSTEDVDGAVVAADSLFAFLRTENLVERRRDDSRGSAGVSVRVHPFGHKPFVQILDEDRIVYASSLALDVKVVGIEGRTESAFSYETTRIGVSRAELRSEADNMSRYFARILRDGAPHTWPPPRGSGGGRPAPHLGGDTQTDRALREWAGLQARRNARDVGGSSSGIHAVRRAGRSDDRRRSRRERGSQVRAYRLAPTGAIGSAGKLNQRNGDARREGEMTTLRLSSRETALIEGEAGPAARLAMRVVVRMGEILGAGELVEITSSHIDGCLYHGDGGVEFAGAARGLRRCGQRALDVERGRPRPAQPGPGARAGASPQNGAAPDEGVRGARVSTDLDVRTLPSRPPPLAG